MLDDDARDAVELAVADDAVVVQVAALAEGLVLLRPAVVQAEIRQLVEDVLGKLFAHVGDGHVDALVRIPHLGARNRRRVVAVQVDAHVDVRTSRDGALDPLLELLALGRRVRVGALAARAHHVDLHAGVGLELGLGVLRDLERQLLLAQPVAAGAGVLRGVVAGVEGDDYLRRRAPARRVGGRRVGLGLGERPLDARGLDDPVARRDVERHVALGLLLAREQGVVRPRHGEPVVERTVGGEGHRAGAPVGERDRQLGQLDVALAELRRVDLEPHRGARDRRGGELAHRAVGTQHVERRAHHVRGGVAQDERDVLGARRLGRRLLDVDERQGLGGGQRGGRLVGGLRGRGDVPLGGDGGVFAGLRGVRPRRCCGGLVGRTALGGLPRRRVGARFGDGTLGSRRVGVALLRGRLRGLDGVRGDIGDIGGLLGDGLGGSLGGGRGGAALLRRARLGLRAVDGDLPGLGLVGERDDARHRPVQGERRPQQGGGYELSDVVLRHAGVSS